MDRNGKKAERNPVLPLRLAHRLDGVSESATLRLNAAVQALKSQGVDVVNLSAGEPDFPVPEAAKRGVLEAVEANRSKYTPAAGIPELRQAIAERTNRQQPAVAGSQPWKGSDVIVTNGGKQAIFNAILATVEPGDEVLIPSPFWLSYPEMVKLAGGVPRQIPTCFSSGFRIGQDQLKRAISPATKMLILNSPGNPTGTMYSREDFQRLGEVLLQSEAAGVWVLSDEIYDKIVFPPATFCSFLEAVPRLHERVITVNGMSKSVAMTGWRVGWSVAPAEVTQGMLTLQGQSTSGVNALAQWASLAALKGVPESYYESNAEKYRRRRDLVLDILGKTSKIELFTPQGAFYAFVGVGEFLKPGEDSMGFAERLLEGARVAVVPGTPFGAPSHVRLSFATDEKSLEEGCRRIVRFLS